jgi:hypothetical protein
VSFGKLVHRGFTAAVIVLGLMAFVSGVGTALGFIDNDHEIVWREVALTLSIGVALIAGIWMIERSALVGSGLVLVGVIVIGVVTLWTVVIPVAMALLAIGVLVRAAEVARGA